MITDLTALVARLEQQAGEWEAYAASMGRSCAEIVQQGARTD